MKRMGEMLQPLSVARGGPLLMVQLENEYGNFGKDAAYLAELERSLRSGGYQGLIFTADGASPGTLRSGGLPDVLKAANFGGHAEPAFRALKEVSWLGHPREFREIRFAFLNEGLFALLAFLAHVVEQGGVAGEVEQTDLAVAIGVEGGLEAAQGERRVDEHFAAPIEGFRFEFGERDDGVDESHVEGLLGVVLAAEIPDFPGFFLADDAGEVA